MNKMVIKRFCDCAHLIRDTIHPGDAGELPYIGLEHIAEAKLSLIGFGKASDVTSLKSKFKRGDILFGKLRPYFRKVVIAPFDGVCSTDIWVVRAKEGIDQRYLFYWMASSEFIDASMRASEGTKMPRAQWDYVERIEKQIPDLTEQRNIAHILGSLDDKIELNNRMNQTLDAMAQALFKSWFMDFDPVKAKAAGKKTGLPKEIDKLFPSSFKDSELGKIPKGWNIKSLGDVVEFAYGKALKEEKRIEGGIPVYGSNGQVGWHNESLVKGPGIIVGRKGNPGIVTWAYNDFYPIDTAFYIVPRIRELSLYYLFYALRAQKLASLGADSAVPGLNRNMAYMSKQLLPSYQIISEFDGIVMPVYSKINAIDSENRNLTELRDTLLPKLISGELRIDAF